MQKIHDSKRLKELQALPLGRKVGFSVARIVEWYSFYEGKVYVSFSGGKDSTILLHLVRSLYPDVPAVFLDTGLEYPEIRDFVKSFDNVVFLKPKKNFKQLIVDHGYPIISKLVADAVHMTRSKPDGYYSKKFDPDSHVSQIGGGRYNLSRYKHLLNAPFKISAYCCRVMKKNPAKRYEKDTGRYPYIAMLASEGLERRRQWITNGCNAFDKTRPTSNPMSFWTENDVLTYAKEKNIKLCSVYGDIVNKNKKCSLENKYELTGLNRTGCVFCLFGILKDKNPNRIQTLKETHPRLYKYCLSGGQFSKSGMWEPSKGGLGMKFILDYLNIPY